jgi:LAO/AO transport system kinase
MQTLINWRRDNDIWLQTRQAQADYWFTEDVRQGAVALILQDLETAARIKAAQAAVAAGTLSPTAAAAQVLASFQAKART